MREFICRPATKKDIPFLVDTIIEAEKSGTDKLSYTSIFNLSESETRKYIADILLAEIDGCELSISSFFLAEINGTVVASVAAWIEGAEGIPSSVIKGNLLKYFLPKESITDAIKLHPILNELYIENRIATIQLGLVYVSENYRGKKLTNLLINEVINKYKLLNKNLSEMYVQVFENNISAIKSYEKSNFEIVKLVKSKNKRITDFLPSNGKVLMKKQI